MNTSQEILESIKWRNREISNILDKVSEEDLNKQPIPGKKTVGEIITHVFQAAGEPFWLWKLFYDILNLFKKIYRKNHELIFT